jgi:hypothetical protein
LSHPFTRSKPADVRRFEAKGKRYGSIEKVLVWAIGGLSMVEVLSKE